MTACKDCSAAEEALRDMTIRADERRVMCDERDALVTKWYERAQQAKAAVERARAVLVDHGHADTCGSELGDYPCSCWQGDLLAALDRPTDLDPETEAPAEQGATA